MSLGRLATVGGLAALVSACDGSPQDPRACLAQAKKNDALEREIAITPEQGDPAMVEEGNAFVIQYLVTDLRNKVRTANEIAEDEDLRVASYEGTDPWAVDNADVLTASFQTNDPLEGNPDSPFVTHEAGFHIYVVSPLPAPAEMSEGKIVGTSFITDRCERFVPTLDGEISTPVQFFSTPSSEDERGQWYAESY